MDGCSSSDEWVVAMVSRVRSGSLNVVRAEVVGRIELEVAGETGAERQPRCRETEGRGAKAGATRQLHFD